MSAYRLPDALPVTPIEAFDRTRLLIDLDEVTDPSMPPTTLLVVGFPRSDDPARDAALRPSVTRLAERIADIVESQGSIYRTRSTEVSALIDVSHTEFVGLLEVIREDLGLEPDSTSISISFVSLPDEAQEAIGALALADQRMATRGLGAQCRRLPRPWATRISRVQAAGR